MKKVLGSLLLFALGVLALAAASVVLSSESCLDLLATGAISRDEICKLLEFLILILHCC
jgi:hypothetical protein